MVILTKLKRQIQITTDKLIKIVTTQPMMFKKKNHCHLEYQPPIDLKDQIAIHDNANAPNDKQKNLTGRR